MNYKLLFSKIKNVFTLEHCVVRFITAWCFVCFLLMVTKEMGAPKVDDIKMVQGLDPLFTSIAIVSVFCILMLGFGIVGHYNHNKSLIIEKATLLLSVLMYAVVCVYENHQALFILGVCTLVLVVVIYCFQNVDLIKIQVKKREMILLIALAFFSFVKLVGTYMAMRAYNYQAPNFDMGIFSQMFHYMKTTFTMKTTCERDYLMSHMCVHIAPDFYLLLPFYWVFSTPVALEVMQVVVVALATVPITLLCLHKKLSRFETIMVVCIYLLYPVTAAGCGYDIHENMFYPVFLFLFLYFIEKDSNKGMIISMILVLFIKEDAPVFLMIIGMYMMLEKRVVKGAIITCVSSIYFICVNKILSIIGTGAITDGFNNIIYNQDGNVIGIIKTLIVSPAYIVSECMKTDKMEYVILTLGTLLFVPFCTKNVKRFVLVIPYIMFNIMANYGYFHNIFFQFSFGTCALLFYMMICNLSEMRPALRGKLLPAMLVTTFLFFVGTVFVKMDLYYNKTDSVTMTIREGLETIPKNSSVVTTSFFVAGLSDHNEVYEFHYTKNTAEYYAFDLRANSDEYKIDKYIDSDQYENVFYEEGIIAIFRNKNYKK